MNSKITFGVSASTLRGILLASAALMSVPALAAGPTAATYAASQLRHPADGQSQTPIEGLQELIIAENQVVDIKAGGYRFGIVELRPNARLRLHGSTTILAGKVITAKGAVIEYVKGAAFDARKTFSLNAIDASGMTDLTVLGSGQDAADYAPDKRAADGRAGEGAMSQMVSGAWYEVPYWKNRSASAGSSGTDGANGHPGEDAIDVTLYLPGLRAGATIAVETIGGRGGRGQNGGYGGQGGGSARLHPAADGGAGGAAGSGGPGGDAGKISVFIVVAPAEVSKKDEIIKTINFQPSYAAGAGGEPGIPGAGGANGDSREHFCVGSGCGAQGGRPGSVGHVGAQGAGPSQGDVTPHWASIDVMDLTTYQQYVTQVWAKLSNLDPE